MFEKNNQNFVVRVLYLFALILSINILAPIDSMGAQECEEITEMTADDCIHLNQIQTLGTHNSYKQFISPEVVELIKSQRPEWNHNGQYEHRPLRYQFDKLDIRKLEIDVYADTEGGLYAEPAGAVQTGDVPYIRAKEMLEPGFKVFHGQDWDYRTHCLTLKSCLSQVRDWSLKHPNHLPIMIMIEVKRADETNIFGIDDEIWEIFSREHVITPDEVRGNYSTLEEAVLESGWPTLRQSRGRVLFALDNTNEHRDNYLAASPILEGRALFVSSQPGLPSAAFIKMNNPRNPSIREWVAAGYLIRTRADEPGREGVSGDTSRREMALNSGAQYISTDYPELSPYGSWYIVQLPGAIGPGRCNPLNAPEGCENKLIIEK